MTLLGSPHIDSRLRVGLTGSWYEPSRDGPPPAAGPRDCRFPPAWSWQARAARNGEQRSCCFGTADRIDAVRTRLSGTSSGVASTAGPAEPTPRPARRRFRRSSGPRLYRIENGCRPTCGRPPPVSPWLGVPLYRLERGLPAYNPRPSRGMRVLPDSSDGSERETGP